MDDEGLADVSSRYQEAVFEEFKQVGMADKKACSPFRVHFSPVGQGAPGLGIQAGAGAAYELLVSGLLAVAAREDEDIMLFTVSDCSRGWARVLRSGHGNADSPIRY